MCKDMLTTCPDDDNAWSRALAASVVAAADSVPRDPAHAVTPDGSPHCKNADALVRPGPRTPCNSRADHTSARKNLHSHMLGAGPRAPPPRQLTLRRWPARAAAVDSACPDGGGAPGPLASAASGARPDTAASAAPPADTARCNSGSVDAAAQTMLRSPSANTAAVACNRALVAVHNGLDTEVGPRDVCYPWVKPRSGVSAPLRALLLINHLRIIAHRNAGQKCTHPAPPPHRAPSIAARAAADRQSGPHPRCY